MGESGADGMGGMGGARRESESQRMMEEMGGSGTAGRGVSLTRGTWMSESVGECLSDWGGAAAAAASDITPTCEHTWIFLIFSIQTIQYASMANWQWEWQYM